MDDLATTDREVQSFERIVSTVERVGIPVATFAMGAWALFMSSTINLPLLPWLGAALILGSLLTYVWLTSRSTIKVESPPPPFARELAETLAWMRRELSQQQEWARRHHMPLRLLGPGMGGQSPEKPPGAGGPGQ